MWLTATAMATGMATASDIVKRKCKLKSRSGSACFRNHKVREEFARRPQRFFAVLLSALSALTSCPSWLNSHSMLKPLSESKIAIIGLGYVGLSLAVEFAKKYPVIGFDINNQRVDELNKAIDHTLEVETVELEEVLLKSWNGENGLFLTSAVGALTEANIYIVTVPTPIDESKRPDLRPLISASTTIGGVLKKGDIVIYESTTYPGCTEEDCVPVLESVSGLKFNVDFFAGYSPERINPGDKVNTLTKIMKVTSGSTPEMADFVDAL